MTSGEDRLLETVVTLKSHKDFTGFCVMGSRWHVVYLPNLLEVLLIYLHNQGETGSFFGRNIPHAKSNLRLSSAKLIEFGAYK